MQHQDLKNLDNEVENYKKTILKEQETNENLTLHHNKACAEENHVKKQIETTETKRSQLRTEYTMYGRVLQETSQALAKENTVSGVGVVCGWYAVYSRVLAVRLEQREHLEWV